MDAARRVIARLERIEALDRVETLPEALLQEVRTLVREAEAWAETEPQLPDSALQAVERCRIALRGASRTLLA